VNGLEERVLLAKYIVTNVSMTGTGSLMEAVGLANTSPGDDTITFDETVFKSDQTIYDDYGYSSSGLWIEDKSGGKLEIQGPTFSALTMSFNTCGEFYIKTPCVISDLRLYVRPSTDVNNNYFYRNLMNYGKNYLFAAINNSSTLDLNNISISTGTGTFNYFATGVMNTGTGKLTINNSSIKGFYSVDYYSITSNPIGSGVWNEGITSLNNVTVMNCSGLSGSGSSGGGIINSNVMTISNSMVSYSSAGLINHGNLSVSFTKITENENGIWNNNVVSILNSEISGSKKYGGIFNNTNGLMTISQSSVTNNIGSSEGTGIKNRSSIGVSIINSTISNNTNSSLSAVLNDTNAKMSISSSTISGNSAGIKALASVLISDSLISNTGYDVSGSVDSISGYNLVANGTGLTGMANGTNGNRIGTSSSKVDAKLQPLNYYGGSTKSVALQALSPAIDAGGTQVSLTNTISNSVTSFAMTNASLLGCTAGLMIPVQVDNEIMMMIAVSLSNNTVTVIRGSSGTQAATHLSGAKVYLLNDQRGISMLNTPDIGAFESQKYILSIASGNNQSQTVNKSLTSAFKVKVTDPKGIAVSGVQVSFNAPAIGAGCSFPSSNLAMSDSSGLATSQVAIANTKAGSYSLTASIPDIGFVTFYQSNVADSFAMVQPYIGDNNRYTVNQTYYYDLIAARSTDQFGNPVPKVPITFNNPNTEGANCIFANSTPIITDNNGVAYSTYITTNTIAGDYQVKATSGTAIPGIFNLVNLADTPVNLIVILHAANNKTSLNVWNFNVIMDSSFSLCAV